MVVRGAEVALAASTPQPPYTPTTVGALKLAIIQPPHNLLAPQPT